MNYKVLFFIIALMSNLSCGKRSGKSGEALIKTLNKETVLLAERNSSHFEKLEKRYQADTLNAELKTLYLQFSHILTYKKKYRAVVFNSGEDELENESTLFVEKCFAQLNEKEKISIRKTFAGFLIMNPDLLKEAERANTLPYQLMLEAEMMVREMQLLMLKDLNARKPEFDWKFYWE